jgi:hypothetical protein
MLPIVSALRCLNTDLIRCGPASSDFVRTRIPLLNVVVPNCGFLTHTAGVTSVDFHADVIINIIIPKKQPIINRRTKKHMRKFGEEPTFASLPEFF